MGDTNGKDHRVELGSVRDSMTKSVVALRPEQVKLDPDLPVGLPIGDR